jgi:polyketide synthase 5
MAAAVVAGALSLEDRVGVICCRSRLCVALTGAGTMASVELPARRVRAELVARGVTHVVVAVGASPQSTVIGRATPRRFVTSSQREQKQRLEPLLPDRWAIAKTVKQLRPLRSATIVIHGATQTFPPEIPEAQRKILTDLGFNPWY